MRATTRLRSRLSEPRLLVAPGAYDALTCRLVEAAGFEAVYMTGAGMAASALGEPDIGLATLTEMAAHAHRLAACVSIPLVADADTGYGDVRNVVRTVREYEAAGVAGLHLEDQVAPKRCGHLEGKEVVDPELFAAKIRAACEARRDPDLVIIARTDARAVLGIDEAIDRANRYADAGADLVFVEAPETVDEMRRIAAEVRAPAVANVVPGGKTPLVGQDEIERLGFRLAIHPAACLAPAIRAVEAALQTLKERGVVGVEGPSPIEIFRRVGLEAWLELERRADPSRRDPSNGSA